MQDALPIGHWLGLMLPSGPLRPDTPCPEKTLQTYHQQGHAERFAKTCQDEFYHCFCF